MNPLADLLLRVALLRLPPGAARDRYAAELRADLWGQPAAAQIRQASSLLHHAGALHRALLETGVLPFPHSPAWCRMRLHHHWCTVTNPDGARYRRCTVCGTDDDSGGLTDGGSAAFSAGATLHRS